MIPTNNPTKKAIVIAIIVGKKIKSPSPIISFQEQVLTHSPLSVVDAHIPQGQE